MIHSSEMVIKQKRFRKLFWGLCALAIFLGVMVVPIERTSRKATITNVFDGIWWSVTTVTSVGYGDMVPVTPFGKIVGMILQVAGVLAFGLLVSLVTVTLDEAKDRFHRRRLNERLDEIEAKIDRIQKQEQFVVKNQVESGEVRS
jgi:voltage-gated potassium channel